MAHFNPFSFFYQCIQLFNKPLVGVALISSLWVIMWEETSPKPQWLTTKYLFLFHAMYWLQIGSGCAPVLRCVWASGSQDKGAISVWDVLFSWQRGKGTGEIMRCLLKLLLGTGPLSLLPTSHWPTQVTWSCGMLMGRETAVPLGKHCKSWAMGRKERSKCAGTLHLVLSVEE